MDDDEWGTPSYAWSWKSAFVYVGDYVATVLRAGSNLVEGLSVQLAASCNHDIDRRRFMEAVALEIETITSEEE